MFCVELETFRRDLHIGNRKAKAYKGNWLAVCTAPIQSNPNFRNAHNVVFTKTVEIDRLIPLVPLKSKRKSQLSPFSIVLNSVRGERQYWRLSTEAHLLLMFALCTPSYRMRTTSKSSRKKPSPFNRLLAKAPTVMAK